MTNAVVLGGGLAGMLAAAVLARYADRVAVVESDQFPNEPMPRKGIPQGRHSHMLLGGGALALDSLLPGTTELLYAGGAKRRDMGAEMLSLSSEGWTRRHPSDAFVIACSRDLIDHVVRREVLRDNRISVLESTTVVGLTGDAAWVTGVRVRHGAGHEQTLIADLVIDATGRRSRAPGWLTALGVPPVPEELVDSGFTYATRLFEVPEGLSEDFPAVLIQPRIGTGQPGRGGTLFRIEDNRWIVSLAGTRGGEPPTHEAGFMEFADSMPHPVIAELLRSARPIGEIRPHRATANRRRYYERLPMPAGFAVLGDAATSLNPIYAHGMAVAVKSVAILDSHLASTGLTPHWASEIQAKVAKLTEVPWAMASGRDLGYPDVLTNREPLRSQGIRGAIASWFNQRMAQTAISEPVVANALFEVYTLAKPQSRLMALPCLLTVLRGSRRPALTADPAFAQYPELSDLLQIRRVQ